MNSCFKIVLFLYFSLSRSACARRCFRKERKEKQNNVCVQANRIKNNMILLVPGFKDNNFTYVQTRAILVIFFQNIHQWLFFLNCS